MKEYKVLTERGNWFNGQIDSKRVEATLNWYASDGWRVVNSSVDSSFGRPSSITTVLERDAS